MLVGARCLRKAALLAGEPELIDALDDLLFCHLLLLERCTEVELDHELQECSLVALLFLLYVFDSDLP